MLTNYNCDFQRLTISFDYWSTTPHNEIKNYRPLTHIHYYMKNIEKKTMRERRAKDISIIS